MKLLKVQMDSSWKGLQALLSLKELDNAWADKMPKQPKKPTNMMDAQQQPSFSMITQGTMEGHDANKAVPDKFVFTCGD